MRVNMFAEFVVARLHFVTPLLIHVNLFHIKFFVRWSTP